MGRIAAALTKHGFEAGDRLAILLPNEPDYIQLVYACAWLSITAVPLNTRLSVKEIDGILADAQPRGLIRHSSLPVPTVQVSWQLVLDQDPLDAQSDSMPDPIYDPNAILALIYTSGTTGRPKGVEITHANILENVYHTNFWFPLEEGAVHLHAAPIFHIADFPFMFAAPAFGALSGHDSKVQSANVLRDSSRRTRHAHCVGANHDQYADAVPGSKELRPNEPQAFGIRRIPHGTRARSSHPTGSAKC